MNNPTRREESAGDCCCRRRRVRTNADASCYLHFVDTAGVTDQCILKEMSQEAWRLRKIHPHNLSKQKENGKNGSRTLPWPTSISIHIQRESIPSNRRYRSAPGTKESAAAACSGRCTWRRTASNPMEKQQGEYKNEQATAKPPEAAAGRETV